MKKILIISFAYGLTSSGKATKRIAEGFEEINYQVKVGCGLTDNKNDNENIELITSSTFPTSPARLFTAVGNLIKRDINYLFWEIRITAELKKLIQNWRPDYIYARSSPAVSFYVGNRLSQFYKIPLILHFADPIPATEDWVPSTLLRMKMKKSVLKPIINAQLLSFVTKNMLNYQQQQINLRIEDKSIITPNPIPNFVTILSENKEKFIFAYLGKFGKTRNPLAILWGIEYLVKHEKNVEMWFIGSENERIESLVSESVRKHIKVIPYEDDLMGLLKKIDCFIDIDSDYTNQVFLSNKLMEYLSISKPIISITSNNSPAFCLLKKLSHTAFLVDFQKENINEVFYKVYNKFNLNNDVDYSERLSLVDSYSIHKIISELDLKLKSIK